MATKEQLDRLADLILIFFLTLLLTVYRCWVITMLWHWFVGRYFSLPELNISEALGLFFLKVLFFPRGDKNPEQELPTRVYILNLKSSLIGISSTAIFGWGIASFL